MLLTVWKERIHLLKKIQSQHQLKWKLLKCSATLTVVFIHSCLKVICHYHIWGMPMDSCPQNTFLMSRGSRFSDRTLRHWVKPCAYASHHCHACGCTAVNTDLLVLVKLPLWCNMSVVRQPQAPFMVCVEKPGPNDHKWEWFCFQEDCQMKIF